jgi:hypothetical protein
MTEKIIPTPMEMTGEVDWDALEEIEDIELSTTRIIPVPTKIVVMAQRSYDEKAMRQATLPSEAVAIEFERLMKGAGDHTEPITSIYVKRTDTVVKYRAGDRRGRKAGKGEDAE